MSCSAGAEALPLARSDRQIHPHCLRTNEPIHLEAPIDKLRGGGGGKYSANAWEGSGECASGPAILFFAHIMSFAIPTPLAFTGGVTGERRAVGGGGGGHLGPRPGGGWRMGPAVPIPLDGSRGHSHRDR